MNSLYIYIMISCILTALTIRFKSESSMLNSNKIAERIGMFLILIVGSPIIYGITLIICILPGKKK